MNGINNEYGRVIRHSQFYFGPSVPSAIESLKNWRHYEINESLRLAAHPNVGILQRKIDKYTSMTLIGYVVDPEQPLLDAAGILGSVLKNSNFSSQPFKATSHIGGRWILICPYNDEFILFADPAGLRQTVYSWDERNGQLHCASEPGLIGKIRGLELDPKAEAFRLSPWFQKNNEYWWPGNTTPYEEVKQLLPNFYLNLTNGTTKRFWPKEPLRQATEDDVRDIVAKQLTTLMEGISKRGNVCVSITAGIDSRIILAASRNCINSLKFMTVQQQGMLNDHPDLTIPQRFATAHNFYHSIVVGASTTRETFRTAYQDSVMFSHEKWLPDAQAIFDAYPHDTTIVIGSMAETARLFYDKRLPPGTNITPELLLQIAGLEDHDFAKAAFSQWLETLDNSFGYDVADLFYWEQRAGRWLASSQLEFGLVWQEIFAPFNNRDILMNLLSLDPQIRRSPESRFFINLIKTLWPDLLSEPINPHNQIRRTNIIKRGLRKARRLLTMSKYR